MSPSRSLPPVKNFRARPAFLMQGQIAEFSLMQARGMTG
jgi:hypothetical protein